MRNRPFSPMEHLEDIDYQKKARRLEKKLAEKLGGKRQPASGATPWAKGDIKFKDVLAEVKQTGKSRYTLKLKELFKIEKEAISDGKIPIMILDIQGSKFVVLRIQDIFNKEV